MNKVELTGKIYNTKVSNTTTGKTITRFGLSIYTGKGKDGKSQYGFVDCKYFGDIMNTEGLKDVNGHLTVDTWEKDGKKYSKPEVIVDAIKESEMFAQKPATKPEPKEEPGFDDDLDGILE